MVPNYLLSVVRVCVRKMLIQSTRSKALAMSCDFIVFSSPTNPSLRVVVFCSRKLNLAHRNLATISTEEYSKLVAQGKEPKGGRNLSCFELLTFLPFPHQPQWNDHYIAQYDFIGWFHKKVGLLILWILTWNLRLIVSLFLAGIMTIMLV